jgi:hypothetical protein
MYFHKGIKKLNYHKNPNRSYDRGRFDQNTIRVIFFIMTDNVISVASH